MFIVLVQELDKLGWYAFSFNEFGLVKSNQPFEFYTYKEAKNFIDKLSVIHVYGIFKLIE